MLTQEKMYERIMKNSSYLNGTNKDGILLNNKQKIGYRKMLSGKNVFLTGAGGCGKTQLIKMFYSEYKSMKNIGLTSTTGTSALIIGGNTLHSFTGVGLGKGSVDSMLQHIFSRKYLIKRWKTLETLIVDEVSMLTPRLFDKLEEIARIVRESDRPFGGVQLVFTGDFLQLPTVEGDQFCFESKKWKECFPSKDNIVYLDEIIRQEDSKFTRILNKVRMGTIDTEVKDVLQKRVGKAEKNKYGIIPTRLFPLNSSVDKINEEELDKLEDVEFREYRMKLSVVLGLANKRQIIEKFRKNNVAPEVLQIAVGAQVMLTYNLDLECGLANGSRGVVVGFTQEEFPEILFSNGVRRVIEYNTWEIKENDEVILNARQIPLRVAYALSIHRIQGATLDSVAVDLKNIFEYGQSYVALSRVRTLQGLTILSIDWNKIQAHPKAVEFYRNLL